MTPEPAAGRALMLSRALRRRCPRCGAAAFDGWFTMKEHCPDCGFRFEREPGYWVGAVVVNTAVIFATFVVVLGSLTLATWPDVPWATVLWVTVAANLVIPVLFYPLSKTTWLALELSWHPLEGDEADAARKRRGSTTDR